jgi:Zn-dependent protease with chaperone function
MFALRGIAVACSIFFLVYLALSLVVLCLWRPGSRQRQRLSPGHLADLLFALRMIPLAAAALVTAIFTIPSFLLLEPRTIEEPLGGLPLALGLCGIALVVFGLGHAAAALLRASRLVARWMSEAKTVESQLSVPVLRTSSLTPALTAAGILRPRLFLSGAAEFVLNENELRTALRHEVAHVRRRDNLKKLSLRFVSFPGMKNLETAWRESTEMAADDAAVDNLSEALDLAAALIKLSKMTADPGRSTELMTAFIHGSAALTNARIERLIQWSEVAPAAAGEKKSRWNTATVTLTGAVAMTAIVAATYSQLLAQVHEATEWLVR